MVAKKIYERTFGDMSKMFCTPLEQAEQPIVIESGPAVLDCEEGIEAAPGHGILGGWEEV